MHSGQMNFSSGPVLEELRPGFGIIRIFLMVPGFVTFALYALFTSKTLTKRTGEKEKQKRYTMSHVQGLQHAFFC